MHPVHQLIDNVTSHILPIANGRHGRNRPRASVGFAFALFAILLSCPTADGAIVGTSGAFAVIAPPPSVAEGKLRSDINVFVFPEEQGKTLAKALDMDVTVPGLYSNDSSPDLSPGTIPKGSVIYSYYLHADSLSASAGHPVIFEGTITFDAPVLGIDVLAPSLDAGINRLGAFDVFYPFEVANSGLEIKQGADGFALDRFTLSADRRTVSIHWQNVGTTDQMRIVTTVPEPSSLVLALGAGLAVFGVGRCRRRTA